MHNIITMYEKFLHLTREALSKEINDLGNLKFYPRLPKMSDCEIIALTLAAEASSIDSENKLFHLLKNDYKHFFPQLIDRTNFNKRRKKLQEEIAGLSVKVAEMVEDKNSILLIDSMPTPIARMGRNKRSKVCKEDLNLQPCVGKEHAHNSYFYGFKLHLITTENGMPLDFCIMDAKTHDIHFFEHLNASLVTDKVMIGDKGYISSAKQLSLFEEHKLKVITPKRKNALSKLSEWTGEFSYKRKRIETLFSQLTEQFKIKQNLAKTLNGFVSRIASKLCTISMLKFSNWLEGKPMGPIKYALK